jgi:hypothetical protein
VLAALGLAAGLTLAGTGTARADITPPVGQWVEIYNPYLHAQGNTLCFDDPNGSTSSGTPLQLWRCHGYASNGAPQRWVFIQPSDSNGNLIYWDGSPVYQVYNLAAGKCLTGLNQGAGAPLTLGPCTANGDPVAGTWWQELDPNGPADFQLYPWPKNYGYGNCVAASNFTDGNGTRLVMGKCDQYDTSTLWNLG